MHNDVKVDYKVLDTLETILTLTENSSGKVHVLRKYAANIPLKTITDDMILCIGIMSAMLSLKSKSVLNFQPEALPVTAIN